MGRTRKVKDLTGIRQRGATYQVRLSAGYDPDTGKQIFITGQAASEAEAIALRDKFRRDIAEQKSSRTTAKLGQLLDEPTE